MLPRFVIVVVVVVENGGKTNMSKNSLCAKCWHFEVRVIAAAIVFHVVVFQTLAKFLGLFGNTQTVVVCAIAAAAEAAVVRWQLPFTSKPRKMVVACRA